jgi:hypothetical protein
MLLMGLRTNLCENRSPPFRMQNRAVEASRVHFLDSVSVIVLSICSTKPLARQFLVAPSESYLPERGADFEQVLVSTVSR